MNMLKSMELMDKYGVCQDCGNEMIGDGQGGIVVEDNTFRRFCKCGFDITTNEDGKVLSLKSKNS